MLASIVLGGEDIKGQFYERMGLDPDEVNWDVHTVVVDGEKIEVLIPVPVQRESKPARFYEYRDDALIHIPADILAQKTREHLEDIRNSSESVAETMNALRKPFQVDTFEMDMSYALMGQFGVQSTENTERCRVNDRELNELTECLRLILEGVAEDAMRLVIIPRDREDIPAGLRALLEEWPVSFEVLHVPDKDPIRFGLGGTRLIEN